MDYTDKRVAVGFRWIATVFGIVGFVLTAVYSHWAVAIGVFLMLWANNLLTAAGLIDKAEGLVDTVKRGLDLRYVKRDGT